MQVVTSLNDVVAAWGRAPTRPQSELEASDVCIPCDADRSRHEQVDGLGSC